MDIVKERNLFEIVDYMYNFFWTFKNQTMGYSPWFLARNSKFRLLQKNDAIGKGIQRAAELHKFQLCRNPGLVYRQWNSTNLHTYNTCTMHTSIVCGNKSWLIMVHQQYWITPDLITTLLDMYYAHYQEHDSQTSGRSPLVCHT